MTEVSARRVIATEVVDQSEAISFLPTDHTGHCVLSYRGRTGVEWVIFSTLHEGEKAAALAIRLDIGGYSDVELHPPASAPLKTPTYDDAWTWVDDDRSPCVGAARDNPLCVAGTTGRAPMLVQSSRS